MLDKLKEIEKTELRDLLNDSDNWNTLDVDYTPPRVERLWMQYDDEHRLLIHKIHPCTKEEALFHPHPWKSAVHVLPIGGSYGHSVGTIIHPNVDNQIYCEMEVHGEMYYEMLNMDSCHSVRPIGFPVYTVMLIGKPIWKDNVEHKQRVTDVKPDNLKPLTEKEKKELLHVVFHHFQFR